MLLFETCVRFRVSRSVRFSWLGEGCRRRVMYVLSSVPSEKDRENQEDLEFNE